MTRKHYEMIAAIINAAGTTPETLYIARELAKKMAEENPRFDAGRFLKACGAV